MLNFPFYSAMISTGAFEEEVSSPAGKGRMLGKLLKYELRATARLYFPLYLAVLILAALGRLSLFGLPWHISGGLNDGWNARLSVTPRADGPIGELLATVMSFVLFAYVLMVLGAFVIHLVITLQRFWKNLMGDEGYLMFTLPVSTDALLWSKAISVLLWSVATLLVVGLSVLILCGHPVVFQVIREIINRNISNASWQRMEVLWIRALPPFLWVLTLLAAVANIFCDTFHFYAAMAIGHTVKQHKILASVGGYIAIAMIEGVASGYLSSALMPVFSQPLSELPVWDSMFLTVEQVAQFADALGDMLCGFMTMVLIVTVIFAAAVYLVTRYILNTQLNLE